MVDSVRTLIDTVVFHDTTRITDTLWVLQSHSAWRDALPLVGSFAAIAAALATAFLAYVFNKRLLRYNIAYGSYRRALARLQILRQTLVQIRELAAGVGMFLETVQKITEAAAAAAGDNSPGASEALDRTKFVQEVRKEWASQSQSLQDANAKLLATKEAIDDEYLGHAPVFPNLRGAVSAYGWKLICDSVDIASLSGFLMAGAIGHEPFPLDKTRSLLRDTKKKVLVHLDDFDRWYRELLELLRMQVFAGLTSEKRRPAKRRGGDPDALHLTLDGFKTAKELGWYDPKLDSHSKKDAK